MTLQTSLNSIKDNFEKQVPDDIKQIMHRATDDLSTSGIMDHVLQPGDQMPDFTLLDEQENEVNGKNLLAKGPLVISFYRGVW